MKRIALGFWLAVLAALLARSAFAEPAAAV